MSKWFPLGVGNLDPYVEQGAQGVFWALHDNSLPGYHGLLVLQDGDWLRVLDESGEALFDGKLAFDYDTHRESDPEDIFGTQQVVDGHQVNGLPAGVDARTWITWFERRLRAVVFRAEHALSTPSLSPLIQAVAGYDDPTRWLWNAPQRFFDGFAELPQLERHRVAADLQPAVAWIAHAFGWSAHDVATSLDIPERLATEWAAPADLPWHRPHPENPEWVTRGAHLLALYAHLHWAVGERIGDLSAWPEAARQAIDKARRSFSELAEAVAEFAPDPDLLRSPPNP